MPSTLNLGNEVVRMRAEVKRVRVLIIRKLIREIQNLKKRKGSEAALEKNQRRAARFIEEIQELKRLVPDDVTKAALQKDISFEEVCKDKDATLSERAAARIATHPQFNKRIQDIKKAIAAFKAERTGAAKDKKTTRKDQSESEQDSEDEEDTEQNSSETNSRPAELVKMRKCIKKVRMLYIRKLTKKIGFLKSKKVDEPKMKLNQERAAALTKELEVLRGLSPDLVTMRALQGNIDVEAVLQDPESSLLERAVARVATHTMFVTKLQDVQKAIESERTKNDEKHEGAEKSRDEDSDAEVKASDEEEEEEEKDEEEEVGGTASDHSEDEEDEEEDEEEEEEDEEEDVDDDKTENNKKEEDEIQPSDKIQKVIKPSEIPRSSPATKSEAAVTKQPPANPKRAPKIPLSATTTHSPPTKSKETPEKKAPPSRQDVKPEPKKPEQEKTEEESDLESSDGEEEEEKEYFDDSTEERFHKQSSLSEESDDDDFFLGKVTRLKKKKSSGPGKHKISDPRPTVEPETSVGPSSASKKFEMESVFCSTLSTSSGPSRRGNPTGPKPPRFQNQRNRAGGDGQPSWFKSQGSGSDRRPSAAPAPRQMGRQQDNRDASGKPFRPPQHSQQSLHPSWEASRKRKEQQSQIKAFQGKKIKFDDD